MRSFRFYIYFPKSEPGQLQTIYTTAWKPQRISYELMMMMKDAHVADNLRMIDQVQECVYVRK